MSDLNISAFRAMMGKYNQGDLVVNVGKKGVEALGKVNNHVVLRHLNNAKSDVQKNLAVRNAFLEALSRDVEARGFGTVEGTAGKAFLDSVRKFLLEGENATRGLSRQSDVARVLDQYDVLIAGMRMDKGAESVGQLVDGENEMPLDGKSLAERVIRVFAKDSREVAKTASDLIGVETGKPDAGLVSFVAKQLKLSEVQVKTILTSRSATVLQQTLAHVPQELAPKGVEGGGDTAQLRLREGVVDAVRMLYAETQSCMALGKLSKAGRQTVSILQGLEALPLEKWEAKKELVGLLTAVSGLADGRLKTADVTLMGTKVALTNAEGELTATLGHVRLSFEGGAKALFDRITAALDGSGEHNPLKNQDIKALKDAGFGANNDVLARKLARWTIMSNAKMNEAQLQGLPNAKLMEIAKDILGGTLCGENSIAKAVADASQNRYYSDDMLSTIQKFGNATTVTFGQSFTAEVPKERRVNLLAADLFCNEDVWLMDDAEDDSRLQKTLQKHQETLQSLLSDADALKGLKGPGEMDLSKPLGIVLDELKNAGVTAENLASFLADKGNVGVISKALNSALSEGVDDLVNSLQEKFSALLKQGRLEKPQEISMKRLTLDKIVALQKSGGGSRDGEFLNAVLAKYLTRSSVPEKRAMLASLLRYSDSDAGDDVKFGAMLKGAGPVFQKLMQGIPSEIVPKSLQGVFSSMKSDLAPIPETVVKAMLGQLIFNSEEKIASIRVDKALGSASVGQAFLCTFTNADGVPKEYVVKMLKPDIQSRYAREKPILEGLAREIDDAAGNDTMSKNLRARLDTISEELNFNTEGQHIDASNCYDNSKRLPDEERNHVATVHRPGDIATGVNILVMDKADGEPLDHYLSKTIDDRVESCLKKTQLEGGIHVSPDFKSFLERRQELTDVLQDLKARQDYLYSLSRMWFSEAVFGSGFFHGDLHAGNIMVSDEKATVIDYGNAMNINRERNGVLLGQMVCACATKKSGEFLDCLKALMVKDNPNSAGVAMLERDRAEILKKMEVFFGKGALNDTASRMTVAINVLQEHGIAVPKAIYNLVQSQSRLQNALEDIATKIDEVSSIYNSMSVSKETFSLYGEKGNVLDDDSTLRNMFLFSTGAFTSLTSAGAGPDFQYYVTRLTEKDGGDYNTWKDSIDTFCAKYESDQEKLKTKMETFFGQLAIFATITGKDENGEDVNLGERMEGLKKQFAENPKESVSDVLKGLRKVQLMARNALFPPLPETRAYGDAVQDAIFDFCSDNIGTAIFSFGKYISAVNDARDEQNELDERVSAAELQRIQGTSSRISHDFAPSEPTASQWREIKALAKDIYFSNDVIAYLKAPEKAKPEDAVKLQTRFVSDLVANITDLYKASMRTHTVGSAIYLNGDLEKALKGGIVDADDKKFVLDATSHRITRDGQEVSFGKAMEDPNFKAAFERMDAKPGKGNEPPDAISIYYIGAGAEKSYQGPFAYYEFVHHPKIIPTFLTGLDGETRGKLKEIGLGQIEKLPKLTDAEIERMADELVKSQAVADESSVGGLRMDKTFYKEMLARHYKDDLKSMFINALEYLAKPSSADES